MVALPTAWVWMLLAWFAVSDIKLLEHFSAATKPGAKQKKTSAGQNPAGKPTFSLYARIAAYVSIAVLFWSLSLSPPDQETTPLRPAEPKFSFSIKSSKSPSEPAPTASQNESTPEAPDELIHNTTLGFQEVFVINLPERTDKRDALSLISALTDIKLTWTSAIRGSNVPDKALPLGVDRKGWRDGGIGSWRSQMNVIRTMVEENIASALILEDDADWDVRLKDQLDDIAQGMRLLLERAHNEENFVSKLSPKTRQWDNINSPYGEGWDILWLGHCGETFPERIPGHHEIYDISSARYTYYALQADETLPSDPKDITETWIGLEHDSEKYRGTRWVHFSGGPTCSQAYALSQTGARKILHALSVGGTLIEQLDNAMSHLCRDHTPWDSPDDLKGPPGYPGANMRCLSVNPPLFSQHKPRGRKAAGSDIETVEDGDAIREVGESPNLVWSARLNVQNLMNGKPMQDQFSKARDQVKKPE
ncbi:hypothetical protein diail_3374 [Diaporthe ilicicola]|nr:hypothetical protein diail_3374 [Diaporthe ilicicola]